MSSADDTYMKNRYNFNELINNNDFDYTILLDGILKGITDIIGVYKPDGTILFYNDEGYEFFNTSREEIAGKKCYEMVGRNCRCKYCTTELAIKSRSLVRLEKYIPELDKYMDCRCNPVINNEGKLVLVVEQLRDITEKRKLEKEIRESEERYRSIVELSPSGIIVVTDGKIVLANNAIENIIGYSIEDLINKEAKDYITLEQQHIMQERMSRILNAQSSTWQFEYRLIGRNNKQIDVQISSSFLMHKGKPSVQCVIRDITESKRQLNNAAKLQKQKLLKKFPIENKAFMEALYVPAKTVSGDSYRIYEVDDNIAVGILYDVSGKGITASLNVSAFKVLFGDAISKYKTASEVAKYLNLKTAEYLNENYVAACCFSFDFNKNEAVIVGAGINRFIYCSKNNRLEEKIVKGSFIGMFEDSVFDEVTIKFDKGDRFYFFTDGLDEVFDNEGTLNEICSIDNITNFKQYIDNYLTQQTIYAEEIKDDCTLLAIEIK